MFSYVVTKNFNWEILTKNLVTFKIWDEVKDEIFFRGDHEKPIYRGELLKRGPWTGQFADLRGGTWQKQRGGVFHGGGVIDTPMYTVIVSSLISLIIQNSFQ